MKLERSAEENRLAEQAEQLYLANHSSEKVAETVGCSRWKVKRLLKSLGVELRPYTLKNLRYPFNGDICEKAYLVGFRIGDLTVRRHGKAIEARGSSTRPAFILLMQNLFSRYGTPIIWRHPTQEGRVDIIFLLDESFSFLLSQDIPRWAGDGQFMPLLAGFSDAEGSWKIRERNGWLGYEFGLTSTRLDYAEFFHRQLQARGFRSHLYPVLRHWKTIPCQSWDVAIFSKYDTAKLGKSLLPYIKHTEKRERLALMGVCVRE